jgi:exosome complex component RRP42
MVDRTMVKIQRQHMEDLAAEGKRLDGREPWKYRKIVLESRPISEYNGSARVSIGGTEVIAGVNLEKGRPYPNLPDQGTIHTRIELSPMASPVFGRRSMKRETTEISRVIDRGIRNSGFIDLRSLAIRPGEEAWRINMDLLVWDFDGNLFDAGSLALVRALQTATLPACPPDSDTDPLPLNGSPLSVTTVRIGGKILVDPTAIEEGVADARFTMVFDIDGKLRSVQKAGPGGFEKDGIMEIFNVSGSAAERIREQLGHGSNL